MTTALICYGSNVASTTLSTANQLSRTTGGAETSTTTTAPNDTNTNEYIEALSQGGTATGNASLPSPDGKGWLLDSTVLEGQTIAAGNWSAIINFDDSNDPILSTLGSIVIRFYKRSSGGTYTSIGSITASSISVTAAKQQVSFSNTSLSSVAFSTGDKLYVDLWYQSGSTLSDRWGGDTMVLYLSNSATAGVANDMQVTTPGYSPSTVTNTFSAPVESVSVSESIALVGQPALTDSVTLSETLSQLGQPTLTDSASLSETLSLLGKASPASESVSLSDTVALLTIGTTSVPAESVNVSDTIALQGSTAIGSYLCKKQITLLHSQVSGGSDLSNFPVAISMTDANLATVANGGYVQNSSGYDIIFMDSTETTKLDHEIEAYTASSGAIVMWVRIPTLSASSDTTIYMYFNNSAISTSQENKTGVWDSNYKAVYHLKEATGTNPADSTSNGLTATENNSPTSTAGQIGSALSFDQSLSQYLSASGTSANITGDKTVEFWIRPTTFATQGGISQRAIFNNIDGTNIYQAITDPTSGFIWVVNDSAGQHITSNNTTTTTGVWYHVVGTYTASSNSVALYINGSSAANNGGASSTGTGSTGFTIGRRAGGNGFLTARLDEIRISNTARSAGWVATSYNNQNSPSTFYSVGALANLSNPESATLSESLALVGQPALTDAVSLFETVSQIGQPTLTDAVSVNEASALSGSSTLDTESVSLSDSLSQVGQTALTDSVSVNEALKAMLGSASLTDIASLSESPSLQGSSTIDVESVSLSDTLSQQGQPTLTESVSLGENLSALQGSATIIDSASLSEALSLLGTSTLDVESVSLSDTLSQQGQPTATDSASLSEALSQQGLSTLASESVALSDSSLFSGQAQIIEIAQLSDSVVLLGLMQEDAESVQLSDSVAFLAANVLIIPAESVNASESLALLGEASPASESVSLSESLALQGSTFGGYLCKKQITIDHTKVISTDQANFPMRVSLTDANLATVANGGYVQNSNGYDIVFMDSTETTKLDHEIESYSASTGAIEMWVRIPTLSASSNTTIWIYFNSSSISTSQENKTGVWDSNYKAVYHLKEATGTNPADSTSNGLTATENNSPTSTAGQIGSALSFDQSLSQYLSVSGTSANITGDKTVEFWMKPSTFATQAGVSQRWFFDNIDGTNVYQIVIGSSTGFVWAVNDSSGQSIISNNTTTTTGIWYHVVGTYVASSHTVTLYINGASAANNGGAASTSLGTTGFNIGRRADGVGYITGSLDEVRISNTARSAGWVATSYNNQNSPSTFYSVGSLINLSNPDTASLAESLALVGQPALTDAVSLSEALSQQGLSALVSESVSLSDILSQIGQSTLTDIASLSESPSLQGLSTLASEPVNVSDSLSQIGQPTLTDAISVNETLTTMQGSTALSETSALSEALALLGSSALAQESVSLSDSLSQTGQPTLTDNTSLSETLTAMQGSTTLASESVNFFEILALLGEPTIIDAASLSEALTAMQGSTTITDSAQLEEDLALLGTSTLDAEAVVLSDILSQQGQPTLTDSVALSETSALQGSSTLDAESVSLSESSLFAGQAQIIEIAQLSDSAVLLGLSTISESTALSEALTLQGLSTLASESVSLSDVLALLGVQANAESVSLTELLSLLGMAAIGADAVSLSEVAATALIVTNYLVVPADAAQLSDILALLGMAQTTDAVTLSDSVVALLGYSHVAFKATTPSGVFKVSLPSGVFKVSRPS